MRKWVKNLIVIVLLVVGVSFFSSFRGLFYKEEEVTHFDVLEYESIIHDFSTEYILGEIMDEDKAIEEAQKVWIEVFGEDIKKQRPYKVSFDERNEIWLIEGTFKNALFGSEKGGVAHIIIRKSDGKVLALWHDA